jgi:hypothetical protein
MWCAAALAGVGLDDPSDDVALDELPLFLGSLSKNSSSETVEVAHGAGGGFVEEADGVGGEELPIAACLAEAQAEVLGGVVGDERLDSRRWWIRE